MLRGSAAHLVVDLLPAASRATSVVVPPGKVVVGGHGAGQEQHCMEEGLEIVDIVNVYVVAPLIETIEDLPLIGSVEIDWYPGRCDDLGWQQYKLFDNTNWPNAYWTLVNNVYYVWRTSSGD